MASSHDINEYAKFFLKFEHAEIIAKVNFEFDRTFIIKGEKATILLKLILLIPFQYISVFGACDNAVTRLSKTRFECSGIC